MSRQPGAGCSIFVGNVPYDAQEEELREIFSKVGNVTSVRVVCDKDTRQPKGYAFCDFSDSGSVQAAIEKLNNVEYNGRKLRIDCAERELHTPSRPLEDRAAGVGGGSRLGGLAASGPLAALPPPVPTVADRLARLREQEAVEQARIAAADAAERAEIARLMETLTPKQVLHLLGEMQRLALRAPEVARALLSENLQLALALRHGEFLAGLVEEPPLPTQPEVRERARSVRETLWGSAGPPVPPGPGDAAGRLEAPAAAPAPTAVAAQVQPPPLLALPGLPALPAPAPAVVPPPLVVPFTPAPSPRPEPRGPYAGGPARQMGPGDPRTAAAAAAAAVVPDLASARTQEQRQTLLERLVQLSPAEIDRLPHETKVNLLDFLQTLPARNGR